MAKKRMYYIIAMILCGVMLALSIANWCHSLIRKGPVQVLIATIPLLLAVLLTRVVRDQFYARGYYSEKQAVRFYCACQAAGVIKARQDTLEQCAEIYREQISSVSLRNDCKEVVFYNSILKEGKALYKKGEY